MDGSGETVVRFDGPPSCFTGDLSVKPGVAVTIVVVRGAGQCRDALHNELGVVFFGANPVMWTCLAASDIDSFKAWGGKTFPGARLVDTTGKVAAVVCPPPNANAATQDAVAAQTRSALTELGKTWLEQARPAA